MKLPVEELYGFSMSDIMGGESSIFKEGDTIDIEDRDWEKEDVTGD